MARFRKKPVIIEAAQVSVDNRTRGQEEQRALRDRIETKRKSLASMSDPALVDRCIDDIERLVKLSESQARWLGRHVLTGDSPVSVAGWGSA